MSEEKKKLCCRDWREMKPVVKILIVSGGIAVATGLFILFGHIMMWLWNWLMPKLFKLPRIVFWEAWGILVLSRILFGRFGGGDNRAERGRKRRLRKRLQELETENGDVCCPTKDGTSGEAQ